jgi:uncharacterized membrane protein
MEQHQFQQEISIIKEMIEKTRKETAESGHVFIFIGLASILFVVIIMTLEIMRLNNLVLPTMIGLTVLMAFLGYLIVGRRDKRETTTTYAKKVFMTILVSCSVAIIILTFLFPLTHVYSIALAPIFASIFFGVILFSASVIYELKFLFWCGIGAWICACVMAYSDGILNGILMIVILFIGFVVPGVIFNRKYRNGRNKNEA